MPEPRTDLDELAELAERLDDVQVMGGANVHRAAAELRSLRELAKQFGTILDEFRRGEDPHRLLVQAVDAAAEPAPSLPGEEEGT